MCPIKGLYIIRHINYAIRLTEALRMAPNQGPDIVRKWQTFRAAPTDRTLVKKTDAFFTFVLDKTITLNSYFDYITRII